MALVVSVLIYALLFGVGYGVLALSGGLNTNITDSDDYTSATTTMGPGGWAIMAVGYLLVFAVGVFVHAAFFSGCLDIADGRPVGIGSFFKPRNLGPAILAALLVGALTGLASALCFLPGLILGIFVQFTVPFVIDRSQSPITGLKSSFSTVSSNFGNALLAWLVELAVVFVGALVCGVGLLVAAPLAGLILVYTYRKLSGGQVVPLEQSGYQPGPPPGQYPA
ncbi:hypothetical protein AWC20_04690 [Mycobacterium parmense]|nr:hypothetical protein AWC20_04690 [Mycobacterium parmense]